MASIVRDLMVNLPAIDSLDDGMMCKCGTNCTVNTGACHPCTHGSRAVTGKVAGGDLLRLRQLLAVS